MFATIFWRAVLPTLPRLRRGPSQMQGLAEARRAKAGCHRQGLCGADGAAPSAFGCGYAAVCNIRADHDAAASSWISSIINNTTSPTFVMENRNCLVFAPSVMTALCCEYSP